MSTPERESDAALVELAALVASRQEAMEARFLRIEAALGIAAPAVVAQAPSLPAPAPSLPPPPSLVGLVVAPSPPAPSPPTAATTATPANTTLESRVGLRWVNRIGVVTLILGVGFAFKTAVDNDWIGAGARVAFGVVAALVCALGGDLLWKRKHTVFAQGLTGLALALLYLSFGASYVEFHLFAQSTTFALMVGVTIASAMLAVRYGSQAIAALALFGGYVTPIVLASGEPHPLIFLGYVALLNAGGFALARWRTWELLEYFVAGSTCVLFAGWLSMPDAADARWLACGFAIVFYAQFSTARSVWLWRFAQALGPIVIANLCEHTTEPRPLLLVFALGGLVVAQRRRWIEASVWTLAWFWLPQLVWIAAPGESHGVGLEFASLTAGFAVFYLWILFNVYRKRALSSLDLVTLAVNPAAYFATSYLLLDPAYHAYMGLFAVALAAGNLALAKLIWQPAAAAGDRRPGSLAIGVALTCFGLAVPIQFAGFTITIIWAVCGAALAWLSARFASAKLSIAACIALGLAATVLADTKLYEPMNRFVPVANVRFLAFAVLAASAFVAARFLRERLRAVSVYIGGHVMVLLAIGLEIVGWVERSSAEPDRFAISTVAVSIMMALYAVMLIVRGVIRRVALDRILGLGLIGIVVVKLYVSDVWSLGRAFRITAFLGLGALLLLVSYLYSRYRAVIERLWKADAAPSP